MSNANLNGRPAADRQLIQEIESTKVPYGMLAVWSLGQASFIVKGGDTVVYVDPFALSDEEVESRYGLKRLFPSPVGPEQITNADCCLITHEHADHLDPDTIKAMAAANSRTLFVAPNCCLDAMRECGVSEARLYRAETDKAVVEEERLSVKPIPAAHEQLELDDEGFCKYAGYVVRLNGVTWYHAGDTIVYDGLVERLAAERIDLAAEGLLLGVVQEGPRVRGRPHRGDAPFATGFEIARGAEARDVGRARGGDGRSLGGPTRPHLGQGAVAGGDAHAGGGVRDGGVVVQDAEGQRLEHHGLRERALHGEDGRSGEVELALAVSADGAREAVILQEAQRLRADDAVVAQVAQLVVAEAERAQLLQQPPGARHHAEAARTRQAPAEQLEHTGSRRGPVAEGGVDHRELVPVGQQGGRRGIGAGHSVTLATPSRPSGAGPGPRAEILPGPAGRVEDRE